MLPDFANPSVLGRIALYTVLAALTLGGCFVPFIYVFGLFPPVLLLFLAAAFLIVYLPLLDWPWLAWRLTGKRGIAVLAFGLALIPSVALPLAINAAQQQLAEQDKGASIRKTLLPAAPIAAREILIFQHDGFGYAGDCLDYCRAMLRSGAVDHVLVTRDMQGDRLERALLFTLQRMSVCPGPEFGREKPLNGLCIAWREVSNPRFDALIEVWGPYDDRDLTLFSGQGGPKARRGDVVIYDCRVLCQIILLVHPAQAKRLAFPVYPVFAFGLDSGGPFGLRYSERPLIVRPPQEVLRAAFGFDVTAGDPRPGFDKDVPHGSPLLPWAKYFRDLEDKRREEADAAYREKLRAMDRPLEIYREKLRTLREQHADCPSPVISNGPEPKYLGCSKQPASNLPTFSQLQQRLGGH